LIYCLVTVVVPWKSGSPIIYLNILSQADAVVYIILCGQVTMHVETTPYLPHDDGGSSNLLEIVFYQSEAVQS